MEKGVLLALLATTCLSFAAMANDFLYVTDRLQVGVHDDNARDSTVLELVPSGTMLEILARDGGLVQVRTPQGTTGWVDSEYLTEERPARDIARELEAWKDTRTEELKAAWDEIEALRAELGACRQGAIAGAEGDTVESAALARLRSENAELQEQLGYALAQRADRPTAVPCPESTQEPAATPASVTPDAPSTHPPAPKTRDARGLSGRWVWTAAGLIFVLGFVLGALLFDLRQRRRHGGFRV